MVTRTGGKVAWCFGIAVLLAVAGWWIPVRWRSLHPQVVDAAGEGTPSLIAAIDSALAAGRPGLARWMAQGAVAAGVPGTNELVARWPAIPTVLAVPGVGPDAGPLDVWLAGSLGATVDRAALDWVMPAVARAKVRRYLVETRAPGTAAILATRSFQPLQFVPVDQPGGQPLEAVILLTALLYEQERLPPTLAAELRGLAESTRPGTPNPTLEGVYLQLLVLSRRLDPDALVALMEVTPDRAALAAFATAAGRREADLPWLLAAARLAGHAGQVGVQAVANGETGRAGLLRALRSGTGSVRWLATRPLAVRPGRTGPDWLARLVARFPELAMAVKGLLFAEAGLLVALAIGSLSGPRPDGRTAGGGMATVLTIFGVGGFLFLASEPVPPATRPPVFELRLRLPGPKSDQPAGAAPLRKKTIMDPTTIASIALFAVLQLAVYVICLRKLREINRRPFHPLVRLQLVENEENLFDAGLYVGIAGTAAALVMQVLHLVEANLLAAYSSNLMGIIGVALVKIRHVRPAKTRLILEAQELSATQGGDSGDAGAGPSARPPASPARPNPFALR